MAVHPKCKQRRQAEEPPRIALAPEVHQQQLQDEEKIADHLRSYGEAGGRKKPNDHGSREAYFRIS